MLMGKGVGSSLKEETIIVAYTGHPEIPHHFFNLGIIVKEIYLLTCDADGTMRSRNDSFGVAVTSQKEAEAFVNDHNYGYSQSYEKIAIFESTEEALAYDQTQLQKSLKEQFGDAK